ncbi:MAG: RNA pseudouridine synthase [Gammaproteobacteria bacterium]|nr:RNA pseudouridine synthase [Gammaproteobacteria bacterium]MCP5136152.1 RNA pseudouridine synthase [Gammaproteobacteria bacterium]
MIAAVNNAPTISFVVEQPGNLVDLLAERSGLPKVRVKDAMTKGAVWVRKSGSKDERRQRRAKSVVQSGDHIALYYDAALLALPASDAVCVHAQREYSVWDKPAGVLAQGTRFGDHRALTRQVELAHGGAFPVHRLDREARGLMLVAHNPKAAATLSQRFQQNRVEKRYRVEVLGVPAEASAQIDAPLDGKAAQSRYRLLATTQRGSILEVRITTGRLHQIRRHLAGIGHPVLGDPRYGQGNADPRGLQLVAEYLAFDCPWRKRRVYFDLIA